MRRTRRLARFGTGLWLVAALSAAETADEIVAKNIQARGGLEKIKNVQSMKMTGTMRLGDEKLPDDARAQAAEQVALGVHARRTDGRPGLSTARPPG